MDSFEQAYEKLKSDDAVKIYNELIENETDEAIKEQLLISLGKHVIKNFPTLDFSNDI